MNNSSLKTTPTFELIKILDIAIENQEQDLVNILAYEIATRIYIPNDRISFEEMAAEFGYKKEEKGKDLTKKR